MTDSPSELLQAFQVYSAELDEHYDRRERIIKTSRDITALSKKLIFHLHRVTQRKPEAVLKEAEPKLKDLANLFGTLQADLEGERYWRYQRQISPGIQEYIEAATFMHFLSTHYTLMTLEQLQQGVSLPVTTEDFLLGIADLTGEVMRYGINSVGKSGDPNDLASNSKAMAEFVRECIAGLDPLAPKVRSMYDKIRVSQASLRKLEATSYALIVRGAEYANFPEALKDMVRQISSRPDTDDREDER
ncbi:Translin [Cystobasidium minutum MCA 4210]|uniref:Translin n=1 Tax=Cystobasidium minutum MCA 4210 TaxID=1397322 RepID=UPI0034CE796F|eukprot:jgi/Rhomi1/168617/fgenesh1_kg.3_\